MKAIKSSTTRALSHGSVIEPCDNSGAKLVKIVSVKGAKTVKKRTPKAAIGDLIFVSVLKGTKEIRKQVVPAIVVRQRMPYRRPDGTRIKFEDNSVVILKDEKGNPKGTTFKGPIAKEATEKWPPISKVATIVV